MEGLVGAKRPNDDRPSRGGLVPCFTENHFKDMRGFPSSKLSDLGQSLGWSPYAIGAAKRRQEGDC